MSFLATQQRQAVGYVKPVQPLSSPALLVLAASAHASV